MDSDDWLVRVKSKLDGHTIATRKKTDMKSIHCWKFQKRWDKICIYNKNCETNGRINQQKKETQKTWTDIKTALEKGAKVLTKEKRIKREHIGSIRNANL